MIDENNPAQRLDDVEQRIARACEAAGRSRDSVRLLAVSKTRTSDEILTRLALGISAFGENYADEAVSKQEQLADVAIEWHFIGPIQSNKTKVLAAHFDWVQSVDREKIVRRLAEQRHPRLGPLNILLQVNIDHEPQKAGCPPEHVPELAQFVSERPELKLRGLMAIPAATTSERGNQEAFTAMRELYDRLASQHNSVDTLSMGMTDDLEAAIDAGSTMVRIGTALFGARLAR